MELSANESMPECPHCRELEARILVLKTKLRDLEDQLEQPPPERPTKPNHPLPRRNPPDRNATPSGHTPQLKKWLPVERVKDFVEYIPECCAKCYLALSPLPGPNDPAPTIH